MDARDYQRLDQSFQWARAKRIGVLNNDYLAELRRIRWLARVHADCVWKALCGKAKNP